ncbi:lipid IV(A) palmitoyltransferase PagP [Thiobacter aerophilum]|uniref:Lipid IV(A) palmitoyltransferase PagP n=1 Tax=Thiobacter aerophilum TaxID=3121275 RepID=A0ABV0EGL1_9BURK
MVARVGLTAVLAGLAALSAAHAEDVSAWARARERLATIWNEGSNDFYLPFHTHHLRFAYSREKIDSYQENPVGFGYGRSLYEDGVWRGLYAMGFQDSHFKPSYMVGYGQQWLWQPMPEWRVGGGFTTFLMTRADIGHYTPFPGILPMASVGYRQLSVEAAYVPGARGAGNLLFFWARIELDRQ